MTQLRTKMIYLANARLPTQKAHGYQIAKMCEAFAAQGIEPTLVHPRRHQFDSELRRVSLFEYYDVRPMFRVKPLPNWDIMPLNLILPDSVFSYPFLVHSLLWGLYAALFARRERADLYYTRDSEIAYWLTGFGLPTAYEAHLVPKQGRQWLLRRIARRPALRMAVTLTSFIKERFVQMGFPSERVIVLPDSVDLSLFEGLPPKRACRRRLGLPLERPIIGYIGRFQTVGMEKGIPELVRAMSCLPLVNGAEPLLLCVGGPMDAVPEYLAVAARHDVPEQRLLFVDRVANSEMPYWLRSFDVSAMPFPNTEHYAYYMSPLKLFETMAAGVPILASNLPSVREVLRHKENAWLVEPDNPRALADGIEALLARRDIGANLASAAAATARQYTWLSRARKIIDFLYP